MNTLLKPLLLGLCLAALAGPATAQQRPYAPEELRSLSYNDQVRVISLEYQEQSRGRRIPQDQLRFYTDQVNRSNWGFSQVRADIAQSLGLGGGVPPPYGGQGFRCDSTGNDARRCPTPWRGPSVMVRQVSNSPCIEGRSWSSQDGQVTVWKGCRAEFAAAGSIYPEPGYPEPGFPGGNTVRCESTDNRARTCQVPWWGPSRLSRQLSKAECREGYSWQAQRGQMYVDHGCRAEFMPGRGSDWGDPIGDRAITCASVDNRSVTCPWPPGYGMPRLLEQLSRQPCIQGQTWGIGSRTAIWVSRGCRGRFGN
ncbi:DUF3011 domain-containing protein [Lysobacter koreensis]|uniref:DUF3011 domain-containing protein n=1 Tax=Lysobacter koreensis TaxID=266122 RepID=A0ABW2YM31_9GAMM